MTRRVLLGLASLWLVPGPVRDALRRRDSVLTPEMVQEIHRILSLTPEQRLAEIRERG